jgi:hypothetical protein
MTPRLLAAFALILAALACVTAAAMVRWRMVEDVIARAPEHWRFNQMRWYSRPNNTRILRREHRRLYPDSKLRRLYAALALAAAALGIGAWII